MSTPFAIVGIDALTGERDGAVHRDWTVSVGADGLITSAGPSAQIDLPPTLSRIDGAGKFLVPGMINAHAHLFADGRPLSSIYTNPRIAGHLTRAMHTPPGRALLRRRTRQNALTQLHSGVTTIRTVGDTDDEVIHVREQIDSGEITGPRLLPAGPLMAITGGHGAPQIALIGDDPETARANTRRNLRRGAQAIKIAATGGVTDALDVGHAGRLEMPEASMRAVCEEAHAAGVLVAAHAQGREGVLAALRAGVDTIEHGATLVPESIELFHDNPASLRGWSALVPTLLACIPLVRFDPQVTGLGEVVQGNARMVLDEMLTGAQQAIEHGIALGIGTDSGVSYSTHSSFWRELDLYPRLLGVDPAAVLHTATAGNASILGLEGVTGRLAPGLSADLVVLEADPLESFEALAEPSMVVVRGERIVRPEIRRIPDIDAQLDTLRV
ncbi:amidohydrolase family protein [Brachybacterium sp. NPDC056505]|uniref:amidohydrolase family protein n=1 Tax=Brachybacterium sp. NPDC056505 TaxID=3345843 RepID=UPI00366D28AD